MGNANSTESASVPPKQPRVSNISRVSARPGQRVVRGPDWMLDNQDGGDGHVGTVIAVDYPPGGDHESSKCVWVLWDEGYKGQYRASCHGACDLRLYDSGPVGIAFPGVVCAACRQIGLFGTRWTCSVCDDYDLCHPCYMRDRHLLDHPFIRIDAPGAEGVKVPPRKGSTKVQVRGIFEGAKVVRGLHWRSENRDGGEGSVGMVLKIRDWDKSTVRSEARVQWPGGSIGNYRLGFNGFVDVKCTKPASGEAIYMDHMPLIAPVDVSLSEVGKSGFRIGEQVSFGVDAETLKRLQQGHGGWTPSITEIINKLGTVQRDTSTSDVVVTFGSSERWIINPEALTKGSYTGAPKVVAITLHSACYSGDEETARRLASDGADLNEAEKDGYRPLHCAAYGNKPRILSLLINRGADINARNNWGQTALHIAVIKEFPDCVRALTEYASRLDVNVQDRYGDTPIHDAVGKKSQEAIEMLVNCPGADFTIRNKAGSNVLHLASREGNNFAVEVLLSKKPDLLNVTKTNGYGALHIAAINGYHDVVKTLLCQPNCAVDLENNKRKTPLMLAVGEGYCDIVELLVQAGADINKPDKDGDTSMHLSLMWPSERQSPVLTPFNSPAVSAVQRSLLESGWLGSDISLVLACFLASRGGDLHRRNAKGRSPLDIAKSPAKVELLLLWTREKCTPRPFTTTAPSEEMTAVRGMVCKMCKEYPPHVRFEPCGHNLYCEECCKRMKICLTCEMKITAKVVLEKPVLTEANAYSAEQKELESNLQSLEDAPTCGICRDRKRTVVFKCGHGACNVCARNLRVCHTCHHTITNFINM